MHSIHRNTEKKNLMENWNESMTCFILAINEDLFDFHFYYFSEAFCYFYLPFTIFHNSFNALYYLMYKFLPSSDFSVSFGFWIAHERKSF